MTQYIVPHDEFVAILANDQLAFTEWVFSTVSPGDQYIPNWHVECIVEYLQAVEAGQIKRLIINMPPRAMKSICVTIAWTAWLLGRNPSNRIISASYSADLAKRHSIDTRLVLENPLYLDAFPLTRLASDQNEKMMFMTTRRGFRKATSVGGSVTGDGGDFLLLDDPIKPDESLSQTVRQSTNAWIDQTFLTRQNKPGESRAVLVMQRLHEDDPTGHLMAKGGWEQLVLPAQFYKPTHIYIGKQNWKFEAGDLMHPNFLTEEALNEKMRDLGPYGYAGQYQQNPTPIGGGEFSTKWIQYYDESDPAFSAKGMNVYILYDPANTKKQSRGHDPDYTAMVVVGLAKDNNYYILDIVRDRLNPTERVQKLLELHKKWNKLAGKPPKVGVEQYGMMADKFFIEIAQKELNYRFPLIELGGSQKKEDRIRRLIPIFDKGQIYLPQNIMYNTIEGHSVELVQSFVDDELLVFPVGRHDDVLDALARITDEKLFATFPKIEVEYLRAGQKIGAELSGGFDKDDFTTW